MRKTPLSFLSIPLHLCITLTELITLLDKDRKVLDLSDVLYDLRSKMKLPRSELQKGSFFCARIFQIQPDDTFQPSLPKASKNKFLEKTFILLE